MERTQRQSDVSIAYEEARDFVTGRFGDETKRWTQFFIHFTERVKLIRVLTPSQTGMLRVFETINSTGVGLTPMNLLKNLLFRKVKAADFPKVAAAWEIVTDEVAAAGETNPLRLLRYFVVSRFGTKATISPIVGFRKTRAMSGWKRSREPFSTSL